MPQGNGVSGPSFCGRRRGGFRLCGGEAVAFRSPPPPLRPLALKLGRNPTSEGRGGSVSRRDHNQAYRRSTHLTGGTNYAEATNSNASRSSGGSAREGKDSHSRQWRLSMAVFLNRNKRPLAAPIEVAELLSEKPPPSHYSVSFTLRERGSGGEALLSEKRPLPQNLLNVPLFGRGSGGGASL